jgi:hypothetical protein
MQEHLLMARWLATGVLVAGLAGSSAEAFSQAASQEVVAAPPAAPLNCLTDPDPANRCVKVVTEAQKIKVPMTANRADMSIFLGWGKPARKEAAPAAVDLTKP